MIKHCIYPQFPGFLPSLNPREIKAHLKKIDFMPLNMVMKIVDENGQFLEWYEEIYSGKRDIEKGMRMVKMWRENVLALNKMFLEGNFKAQEIQVKLLCLGWIAGDDTMIISL